MPLRRPIRINLHSIKWRQAQAVGKQLLKQIIRPHPLGEARGIPYTILPISVQPGVCCCDCPETLNCLLLAAAVLVGVPAMHEEHDFTDRSMIRAIPLALESVERMGVRWLFQRVPMECQALEVSFDLHQACIALFGSNMTSACAVYCLFRAQTAFPDAKFGKVKL